MDFQVKGYLKADLYEHNPYHKIAGSFAVNFHQSQPYQDYSQEISQMHNMPCS